MAQTTQITIDNQTFPSFRQKLNESLSALNTLNSGTSRPSSAVAGTIWLDTTSATNPTLKFYDGADDISLATIDYSANTVNWLDSSVTLTSPVSISGSASAGAEIRLPEDTDNGSNYVGLKAPDSIASDITFTLPSSDGTADQVLKTDGSGNLSFTDVSGGLSWQSVQTTGFTASAGNAYPCNTTSAGFTVTLPATPSAGEQVQLVDYAGTFDSNALIINPNGKDIEGGASNFELTGKREGVILTYIDSTQGWIATSGINEGTDALAPSPYSVDFLVIAGGGGAGSTDVSASGGGGAGGYRNSYSTETSGGGGSSEASLTFNVGTVYTVTVGAGGASVNTVNTLGNNGSDSSISGTGISTITSIGGGGGKGGLSAGPSSGGSGGGAGGSGSSATSGASGTANQGNNGGSVSGSTGYQAGGGGGGAGAVGGNASVDGVTSTGGNGGNGLASSITGSSVTRAGGGGGGGDNRLTNTQGTGGTGGGGDASLTNGVSGTINTGSGGGSGNTDGGGSSGAGGKGVVILRMATSNYSGTTTGSPTVTTDGSDTVIIFNDSGSITG